MGEKACSLVTRSRLKIWRVFFFTVNCILLFLQQDVIILDPGPEYSFVKIRNDMSSFTRNNCSQQEKKKNGQPSTGHCFYNTRRHRVIPISLFSRKGIQTAWTYHVIQRKLILNFSLAVKKLFLSCTSREICQYFPILIAGWKSTHSVVLRDISLAFCISLNFLLVSSSWRLTHWDCQCFRDLEPFCGQRIASFRRYHKDHQTD